jgi:hypothetical protein
LPTFGGLGRKAGVDFLGILDREVVIEPLWRAMEGDTAFVEDEDGIVEF